MGRGHGGVSGVVVGPGCRGAAAYTTGGLSRGEGGQGGLPLGLAEEVQGWRVAVVLHSVVRTVGGVCRQAAAFRWSAAGRGGGSVVPG